MGLAENLRTRIACAAGSPSFELLPTPAKSVVDAQVAAMLEARSVTPTAVAATAESIRGLVPDALRHATRTPKPEAKPPGYSTPTPAAVAAQRRAAVNERYTMHQARRGDGRPQLLPGGSASAVDSQLPRTASPTMEDASLPSITRAREERLAKEAGWFHQQQEQLAAAAAKEAAAREAKRQERLALRQALESQMATQQARTAAASAARREELDASTRQMQESAALDQQERAERRQRRVAACRDVEAQAQQRALHLAREAQQRLEEERAWARMMETGAEGDAAAVRTRKHALQTAMRAQLEVGQRLRAEKCAADRRRSEDETARIAAAAAATEAAQAARAEYIRANMADRVGRATRLQRAAEAHYTATVLPAKEAAAQLEESRYKAALNSN